MSTGYAGTSYEPTWTTKQAAEFLGIARKTLYNRVYSGEAPAPRKMGKLNAFIPSEIAAYRDNLLGLTNESNVINSDLRLITKKPGVSAPGQNIDN